MQRGNQQQQKHSNRFHDIRQREFRREAKVLSGHPADLTPSYFTPSLKEICAHTIAKTFDKQNDFDKMRELDSDLFLLITEQLSPTLPLDVTVPRVNVDDYWYSCCTVRWNKGELTEFTERTKSNGVEPDFGRASAQFGPPTRGGWKRVYLERNLEEHLMSWEPASEEKSSKLQLQASLSPVESKEKEDPEKTFLHLCELCSKEIYSVVLPRQRMHFDILQLFRCIPHLEVFQVTYGVLTVNIYFNMDMVGLKPNDATALQSVLRASQRLRVLSLPENQIDDDLCQMIVGGLVGNKVLTSLDLSHNKITDEGATAIGLILLQQEIALQTINLGDNCIKARGAKALGQAIAVNQTLKTLSLRMNRIDSIGGEALFEGLRANKTLTALDLSANCLGEDAANALYTVAAQLAEGGGGVCLRHLYLNCNKFGQEGGEYLVQAATAAKSIVTMDVRTSNVDEPEEQAIASIMAKRVYQEHMEKVESAEAKTRAENDRLVAEKLRKTHGMPGVM